MKKISEEQVKAILSPRQAIDVVETAFADYAADRILMGDRGTLKVSDQGDDCIFLPAVHRSQPYFCMKYAASFPSCAQKNLATVQSVIWLFSSQTGEPCAMIGANLLTALKTGAASAVAAKYLSIQDAKIITVIGAGEQAKTQLSCIARVRDLQEIHLVDLDHARCEELKDWIEKNMGPFSVWVHTCADEPVKSADIVVTCTTSHRPVLNGEYVQPGTHINAIGSFTPDMQEIDEQTILKSDKIIADSVRETWKCSGDMIVPMKKGLIPEDHPVVELGDIIRKKAKGRGAVNEITLYESVGFSPLDLAVAIEVYQRALA